METRPPQMIERIARVLLPPASREHVLGDLLERHRSPIRFLGETLRTLPFVIVSRLRRVVNPGLSAFLALYFWFGVFWGTQQRHWWVAGLPALVSVSTLALRDVYRGTTLQPYRAATGDVVVTALAVLASQALCALLAPDWRLTTAALSIGMPLGFGILFFLRVQSPTGFHQPLALPKAMTLQQLAAEVTTYETIVRRAIRIEIGAAFTVAGIFAAMLGFAPIESAVAVLGFSLTVVGAAFVGVFLFRRARLRSISRNSGFAALAAEYRDELAQRLRLSQSFLWWYVVPLVIGPAVLCIGLQLGKPGGALRIAVVGAFILAVALMLVFMQRPMIANLQRRIAQLAVLTEKV